MGGSRPSWAVLWGASRGARGRLGRTERVRREHLLTMGWRLPSATLRSDGAWDGASGHRSGWVGTQRGSEREEGRGTGVGGKEEEARGSEFSGELSGTSAPAVLDLCWQEEQVD